MGSAVPPASQELATTRLPSAGKAPTPRSARGLLRGVDCGLPVLDLEAESCERGTAAFVFFACLRDHAGLDQILEFFVGPEAEHFLAAAGYFALPEIVVDDIE